MAGDHTVQILLDCLEREQNRLRTQSHIFMVPSILRDLSPGSFEPRLVSIGPLHSERKNVQESSGLKESYLHDLLHSFDSSYSMSEQTLIECVEKVNTSIDQIKASYSGMESTINDADLAKMMVLDGCFILEFCYKHFNDYKRYLPNMMQNVCIAIDLILVENQIPFFVLQHLFDCTLKKHVTYSLTNMLYAVLAQYLHPFYYPIPETGDSVPDVATDSTYDHILGLFHRRYKLPQTNPSEETKPPLQWATESSDETKTPVHSAFACFSMYWGQPILGLFHILRSKLPRTAPLYESEPLLHSVVDLDRSGVKFMPHQDETFPMTIHFKPPSLSCILLSWGKPTLFLPKLVIDDYSETVLRNFIAYEQSVPQVHYHFTSYVYAMNALVYSEEDVSTLIESKVLVSRLGSHEEVLHLINRISRNILVVDFCYTKQLEELDCYYNGYWTKSLAFLNIAWLKRTYFRSPWNAIGLIAGIILFFLTVVQTYFTIWQAKGSLY